MFRLGTIIFAVLYKASRHRTVGSVGVGVRLSDLSNHRVSDFHGSLVRFLFYGIGSIVTRTAFDDGYLGIGHERQKIARLLPDVLDPLVAGGVVGHNPSRFDEVDTC